MFDKVFIFRFHRRLAFAAPALAVVQGDGIALDISGPGNGDHHVFFDDHVFEGDFPAFIHDLGTAGIAEFRLDFSQFVFDQFENQGFTSQNLLEPGDVFEGFVIFLDDFFPFETGQPLQTHVQNGLGLNGRQRKRGDESGFGLGRRSRSADQADHGIEIVQSDFEAFQNVGPFFGFSQIELGAPDDHLFAVTDEIFQDFFQCQQFRPVVDNGQ